MSALSIFNGAVFAASTFANGLEKKATTLLSGMELSRVIVTGFAVLSFDRVARESLHENLRRNKITTNVEG